MLTFASCIQRSFSEQAYETRENSYKPQKFVVKNELFSAPPVKCSSCQTSTASSECLRLVCLHACLVKKRYSITKTTIFHQRRLPLKLFNLNWLLFCWFGPHHQQLASVCDSASYVDNNLPTMTYNTSLFEICASQALLNYFRVQWNLDYPNLVYPHTRLSELIFGAFNRLIRYSVFNYTMNCWAALNIISGHVAAL